MKTKWMAFLTCIVLCLSLSITAATASIDAYGLEAGEKNAVAMIDVNDYNMYQEPIGNNSEPAPILVASGGMSMTVMGIGLVFTLLLFAVLL